MLSFRIHEGFGGLESIRKKTHNKHVIFIKLFFPLGLLTFRSKPVG